MDIKHPLSAHKTGLTTWQQPYSNLNTLSLVFFCMSNTNSTLEKEADSSEDRLKCFPAHYSDARQADWRSDRWASSCITGMDMKGSPVPGPILIRPHWSELLFINHALSTEVCAAFIGYLVSSLLSFTATTALFCLQWTRHYSRYSGPFLYRCKSCHIQWDVCIEDAEGLRIHIHSFFSKGQKKIL